MDLLFSKISIGKMEVKNRIVMAPMEMNFATTEGAVTSRNKAYYEERAKGGVGLIIVENTYVDRSGRGRFYQLGLYDDKLIPGFKELADIVHLHSAKVALQLGHSGRQTARLYAFGLQPLAPSPVACKCSGECHEMPKELTVEEIKQLVEAFGEGARRAKKAGFDAVEIHGAHGYLVSEFVSPYTNKRADEYGGDSERRMRFPLEVVARIRDKAGADFPILYRMNADDFVEGGLTIDGAKLLAKRLEEAGINAIDVSGAIYESSKNIITYMAMPRGNLLHLARAIKEVVNVPVIAVGGIDHSLAEKVVKDGTADMVAIGRALLADAYWPTKIAEGRLNETRRCIRCKLCVNRCAGQEYVACTVNAMAGNESEYRIEPAKKPRKVLVVGGGVAGMEAARLAAMRGHHVTLCEKSGEFGGQVVLGSKAPGKGEFRTIVDYLTHQIRKLNVSVKLNQEVDLEFVEKMKPGVVIIATGAVPIVLNIPGVNQPNVVTAYDVLAGRAKTEEKVLVVGGGVVGAETALFLAEKSKNVTILCRRGIAIDAPVPDARNFLLEKISYYDVKVISDAKVREIKENSVVIEKLRYLENPISLGIKEIIKDVGTVVFAVGSRSERSLADSLVGRGFDIYTIGDCESPRSAFEAIHEGFQIALRI